MHGRGRTDRPFLLGARVEKGTQPHAGGGGVPIWCNECLSFLKIHALAHVFQTIVSGMACGAGTHRSRLFHETTSRATVTEVNEEVTRSS